MSSLNEKIRNTKNLVVEVGVSKPSGSEKFMANVKANLFNPDSTLPNGGPVTIKSISLNTVGESFEEAKEKALQEVADLLGL